MGLQMTSMPEALGRRGQYGNQINHPLIIRPLYSIVSRPASLSQCTSSISNCSTAYVLPIHPCMHGKEREHARGLWSLMLASTALVSLRPLSLMCSGLMISANNKVICSGASIVIRHSPTNICMHMCMCVWILYQIDLETPFMMEIMGRRSKRMRV